MNSSTTDKIKGGIHEAKGKVKEEAGKAIGNPDLRDQRYSREDRWQGAKQNRRREESVWKIAFADVLRQALAPMVCPGVLVPAHQATYMRANGRHLFYAVAIVAVNRKVFSTHLQNFAFAPLHRANRFPFRRTKTILN